MNEKPRNIEIEGYLLQVKKIGNSVGFILPKELLARLKLKEGDKLHVIEQPERGFKLSPAAEHQVEQALPLLANHLPEGSDFWRFLQDILPESHAPDALRAMHSLHLLKMFLPELAGIDALAVRDPLHRFTVDEHTLQIVENLHNLRLRELSRGSQARR